MIEQQGNGRWKVTVERPGAGRRRICRTVDTEAQAELLEQQLGARPASGDGKTVADALEQYLVQHAARFTPGTRHTYRSTADLYVVGSWLGTTRLDQLDEQQVERYYTSMLDGSYRPGAQALATRTVRRVASLVRAALDDVRRLGWVRADQYRDARVLGAKPRRRADEQYDLADVARVVDAGGVEVADLAQLAVATGARRGELAALRWRDVDLVSGVLTIEGSITRSVISPDARGAACWLRKTTKTGRPRRLLLDAECLRMLTDRYARQLTLAAHAGLDADDDLGERAVLSVLLERDYTSPAGLHKRWHTAAKAAGVTMRLHDLRHVFASELLAGGVDVVAAAARGGWASTQTLLDNYAHVLVDRDDRAPSALGAVWQRVEGYRTAD